MSVFFIIFAIVSTVFSVLFVIIWIINDVKEEMERYRYDRDDLSEFTYGSLENSGCGSSCDDVSDFGGGCDGGWGGGDCGCDGCF